MLAAADYGIGLGGPMSVVCPEGYTTHGGECGCQLVASDVNTQKRRILAEKPARSDAASGPQSSGC